MRIRNAIAGWICGVCLIIALPAVFCIRPAVGLGFTERYSTGEVLSSIAIFPVWTFLWQMMLDGGIVILVVLGITLLYRCTRNIRTRIILSASSYLLWGVTSITYLLAYGLFALVLEPRLLIGNFLVLGQGDFWFHYWTFFGGGAHSGEWWQEWSIYCAFLALCLYSSLWFLLLACEIWDAWRTRKGGMFASQDSVEIAVG